MMLHQILSMATLVYICHDEHMFETRMQKYAEILSEFFLLFICVSLPFFNIYFDETATAENLEIMVFTILGLLCLINACNLIYSVVVNRREK